MSSSTSRESQLSPVSMIYKEEGDTRVRCGPLFYVMSDGSRKNYRDTAVEPLKREDGAPHAAWFRIGVAKKIAKQLGLKLEVW